MRKLILVLCFALPVGQVSCQSLDLDLSPYNYFFANPSFYDTAQHVFTFSARQVKVKVSSEFAGLIAYQGRLDKLNSTLGFLHYSEDSGPSQLSSMGFAGNHLTKLGEKAFLSFGAKAYYQTINTDYSYVNSPDIVDPLLPGFSTETRWLYDVGVYFSRKAFFAAAAGLNLTDRRTLFPSGRRRLNLIAGGRWNYRDVIRAEHSVVMRYGNREFNYVDINNKALVLEKIWLGLMLRTSGDVQEFVLSSGLHLWRSANILFLIYTGKHMGYEFMEHDFKGEMMVSIKL